MTKLDKFGELVAELRDSALNRYLDIESQNVSLKKRKEYSETLRKFTEEERRFIARLITECVDVGVHDFLFALEEERNDVSVFVGESNVAEMSDGLQGEIYTEDGWFEKFSQHREKGI